MQKPRRTMFRKTTRKRGADTNQNIFYLVVAAILLAAAAYGLQQGLKFLDRQAISRDLASINARATEILNAGGRIADLSSPIAEVAASYSAMGYENVTSFEDVMIPLSGSAYAMFFGMPGGGRPVSDEPYLLISIGWTDASASSRRMCRSLLTGMDPTITGLEMNVESGVLGRRYQVLPNCEAAEPLLIVYYFY